ncbi:MAG: band 7 protein [Myxococcaceae bacterium]|nr:band 7 protein [Myxococcaceae bacterium]
MDLISIPGLLFGAAAWFGLRYVIFGFYTVAPNERAVKTSFGKAEQLQTTTLDNPMAESLRPEERERYKYPQVRVIPPGGPYFKWPWEKIYKASVATETVNMAWDVEDANANRGGTMLEAVTKDQLNTGLVGQLRFRVNEQNLYAYLFAVKRPIVHVMGYFVSILRQRIAAFEAPKSEIPPGVTNPLEISVVSGVSINDLRKNLRILNETMDRDCTSSSARYGIQLDAALITDIDPPVEVESALAAINTAHNHVSSDISLAQASADQRLVQSRRAVEVETLNAQAEVEPLVSMATQLVELKKMGPDVLKAYTRNVRLSLFAKARQAMLEVKR